MSSQEPFWLFPQADDIRALLIDAMPPDALPTCFKPQATVVSASVISPASTPSCLSAASSIDNLAGPLTELAAAAVSTGSTGVADGATGSDRKEGESMFVPSVLMPFCPPAQRDSQMSTRAKFNIEKMQIRIQHYFKKYKRKKRFLLRYLSLMKYKNAAD